MSPPLPVIDLAGLETGDPQRLAAIAAEIGAACRQVGFFYVINHGISPDMLAAVFAQSHAFFALPITQKRAIALEKIGGNRGYSGLLHEALDPTRGADFKEAFNTGLELAANDPELLAGVPFRSLNAWPDIAGFRETLRTLPQAPPKHFGGAFRVYWERDLVSLSPCEPRYKTVNNY